MSDVGDPAPCKICGLTARMSHRRAPSSDPRLSPQATYDLAGCSRCGSEFIVGDRYGTSEALYRGGTYAQSRPGLNGFLEPLRKLADRERMRHVESLGRSARVLEVGAGDGRFAAALAARQLTVVAIDPAAGPEDEGVERVTLEDLSPASGSFDAAIFWHVLEHVADPEAALRRVHGLLAP